MTTHGAKTDRVFPLADGTADYVEAEFGDEVYVTVQLTDGTGAATTAGADGTKPATFEIYRAVLQGGVPVTAARRSGGALSLSPVPSGRTVLLAGTGYAWLVTGADGSLVFSVRMEDPDTTGASTIGSVVFAVRSYPNAPGATGNDGTTLISVGIVRYTEPT